MSLLEWFLGEEYFSEEDLRSLMLRRVSRERPVLEQLGGNRYFVLIDWAEGSFVVHDDFTQGGEGELRLSEEAFFERCAKYFNISGVSD